MKKITTISFCLFILAIFCPSAPIAASTSVPMNAGNTSVLMEKMKNMDASTLNVQKFQQKKGFFGKVKTFGSKVKMIGKGLFGKAGSDDKQLLAVLLAFFLGGLGIHRVYLGAKPIIILWYILTLGGIFGLLPLIDFIRLLLGHVDHYTDNNSLIAAFQ